jgi:hypothetical protein
MKVLPPAEVRSLTRAAIAIGINTLVRLDVGPSPFRKV